MAADTPQTPKIPISSVITIPGYKILDILGRGGMAIVYKATQESVGRTVAIKVLAPNHNDDTFTERFLREAQIISNLTHPNIITVFDAGVIKSHHYMSMEYIKGKSLRDARDDLTRRQKVNIVKQIALALDYIGKKAYVHRDIKPDNIMLHEDGRAVLMDFGIARGDDTKRGLTLTGKAIGTPYYMSPEQTKGIKVDSRSDIYSLGVVLFQSLTGYVPYDGNSFVDIGMKHITQAIPMLPKGLEFFQAIINTALSKDPDHRYQTAAELIGALNTISLTALDKVDDKASVLNSESVDYDSATVMDTEEAQQSKPVINKAATSIARNLEPNRARKKVTGKILHQKIAVVSELEVTKNIEIKKIKRRKKLLFLLLITTTFAAVYYNKKVIEPYFITYIVPVLNEYLPISVKKQLGISNYLTKYQDHNGIKKEIIVKQKIIPITTPAVLFNVDNFLSKKTEEFNITEQDISKVDISEQQLRFLQNNLDNRPNNALKLIVYYAALLKKDKFNIKARKGIPKLRSWFILQIKQSIKNNNIRRGKNLLGILKENFPNVVENARYQKFEKILLQKESIKTHLKLAEQYIKDKQYIEPLSENAFEELVAVLDIDKDNVKAINLQRKILDIFVAQVKNLQATKDYEGAILSAESGLKISSNDAFLKSSFKNLQNLLKIQQQIDRYLILAKAQMVKGNFVTPKNNNAYKIYKSIYQLDKNNKQAAVALLEIESNLVKQANQAMRSNNISNAKLILQLLEQYYPESTFLKQTQTNLAQTIEIKKPAISVMYFSDILKTTLDEMKNVKVQSGNSIYIGFKFTNFPKTASYLLVNLLDDSAINKLLHKTIKIEGTQGEQMFLIKIPGKGLQPGAYYIEIKFGKKSLLKKALRVFKP